MAEGFVPWIFGTVCLLCLSIPLVATAEGERTVHELLLQLRDEEQKLLGEFGSDHPRVQVLKDRQRLLIELLRRGQFKVDPRMYELRAEELQLSRRFASQHPRVKKNRRQQELLLQQMIDNDPAHALRSKRQQLLERLGPDHPDVKALSDRLHDLEQLRPLREHPELLEMRLRERELLRKYGADHPQVKLLRNQIEVLRRHFFPPDKAPPLPAPQQRRPKIESRKTDVVLGVVSRSTLLST
jgi:hypothetical protein